MGSHFLAVPSHRLFVEPFRFGTERVRGFPSEDLGEEVQGEDKEEEEDETVCEVIKDAFRFLNGDVHGCGVKKLGYEGDHVVERTHRESQEKEQKERAYDVFFLQ